MVSMAYPLAHGGRDAETVTGDSRCKSAEFPEALAHAEYADTLGDVLRSDAIVQMETWRFSPSTLRDQTCERGHG
jgi:hypothetical protein